MTRPRTESPEVRTSPGYWWPTRKSRGTMLVGWTSVLLCSIGYARGVGWLFWVVAALAGFSMWFNALSDDLYHDAAANAADALKTTRDALALVQRAGYYR